MARTRIDDNWIRTISSLNGEKFTFCGALEYRYKHIATYWNDNTRKKYEREYNDIILPSLINHNDKAIEEYTKDDYETAINSIRDKGYELNGVRHQYAETTIHHFQNLIYFVVFHSSVYGLCENVLWGTAYMIDNLGEDKEKESRVKIKKSLTFKQENALAKELLADPYAEGSRTALLLMWGLGLRNAEACGLNYSDIKTIEGHPDCYVAWIYKTTQVASNELQSGGKTYNTGRIIPVPDKIVSLLQLRKQRIQHIIHEHQADVDVNNLPICCTGYIDYDNDNYLSRCKANDITYSAHHVFEKAGISSEQVAILDEELSEGNTASILKEKEPTAYLLRRNYATQMCILGLTNAEMQYLMGHCVEDAYESRNEFVDSERIYLMYSKLHRRRILNLAEEYYNEARIQIPKNSIVRIDAIASEPTDSLCVTMTSNDPESVQAQWFGNSRNGVYDRTVNILQLYNSTN